MNVLVIDHHALIRLCSFFGIFLLMATLEMAVPRRTPRTPKPARWFTNLSLTFLNGLVGRFVFPLSATALAVLAGERGWGLFHYLHLPSLATGVISIVLLDLTIY